MEPLKLNIEKATLANKNYRKVIFTGKNMQLVLMSLLPQEDIALEVHEDHDQLIYIESGLGKVWIGKDQSKYYNMKDSDCIIIPAGTWHRVKNISQHDRLSLFTVYSPPEHPPKTVQKEKRNVSNSESKSKRIKIFY